MKNKKQNTIDDLSVDVTDVLCSSNFLKEKISYGLFLNGAHIINNVFLHDFEYFLLDDADWMMVADAYQEIAAGLFYVDFTFAFGMFID